MAKRNKRRRLDSIAVVVKKDHDNKDVKWLKHYSSSHQILSVGDGDFSFSLCLATAFGSASKVTATSLDSYDEVIKKYKDGKSNIEKLKMFGARVLHGVDAAKMACHTELKSCKFDRIVFNFPHAGFHGMEERKRIIRMHQSVIDGFFKNASRMLRCDGEVHVSHKTTKPYSLWNLKELASRNSLSLKELTTFILDDYPGYNNKRGDHPRCDDTFPLGESSTYKFIFSGKSDKKVQLQLQNYASSKRMKPSSLLHYNYREMRINRFFNDADIQYVESLSQITSSHCSRMFDGHVFELFGKPVKDVAISLHEDLRHGYNQYMAESSKRTVNGYIYLLCELQRLSISESARLRGMLGIGTPLHSQVWKANVYYKSSN